MSGERIETAADLDALTEAILSATWPDGSYLDGVTQTLPAPSRLEAPMTDLDTSPARRPR